MRVHADHRNSLPITCPWGGLEARRHENCSYVLFRQLSSTAPGSAPFEQRVRKEPEMRLDASGMESTQEPIDHVL